MTFPSNHFLKFEVSIFVPFHYVVLEQSSLIFFLLCFNFASRSSNLLSGPMQDPELLNVPELFLALNSNSMSVKEPVSQGSAPVVEEEVQQKLVPTEAGNVDC
jgi:hypothetical protein